MCLISSIYLKHFSDSRIGNLFDPISNWALESLFICEITIISLRYCRGSIEQVDVRICFKAILK